MKNRIMGLRARGAISPRPTATVYLGVPLPTQQTTIHTATLNSLQFYLVILSRHSNIKNLGGRLLISTRFANLPGLLFCCNRNHTYIHTYIHTCSSTYLDIYLSWLLLGVAAGGLFREKIHENCQIKMFA